MLYGLYLSAAGLQTQEQKQSIITNNLANVNTNGFKRDLAVVQTRANAVTEDPSMSQYRVPELAMQGGGVWLQGAGVDLTQASVQKSNNPTDLALEGRGFFVVQGEKGQTTLTRDGRFLINSEGSLVTASGRPVLGADDQPIMLNPTLPVVVDQAGTISQGDGTSVQLKLADVTDSRHLVKMGANLLTVDDEKVIKTASTNTLVRQGNLELSGVDPVTEIVNMMTGQRIFDANARMISLQDTTLQEANTIGKVA